MGREITLEEEKAFVAGYHAAQTGEYMWGSLEDYGNQISLHAENFKTTQRCRMESINSREIPEFCAEKARLFWNY